MRIRLPALKGQFENFLFILPAVLIFSIFYIYPFYDIFRLSLHQWDGISPFMEFIGFANFTNLMKDMGWWISMKNAFYITFIALTFQNVLAFILAMACDREIRLKGLYRVIFFIPPVLSEVVVGLVWLWILSPLVQNGEHVGLLNHVLNKFGMAHLVNDWLSDKHTALTTIAIVHSWKGFGWGFIMFLAGLQTIDRQLYEAARVDGAGSFSVFKNVTIPMMMPVIAVVVILTILGSMQAFVLIIAMIGPSGIADYTQVPVTKILEEMSKTHFGYACAMGVLFGLILITVSFGFKQISDRMKQA